MKKFLILFFIASLPAFNVQAQQLTGINQIDDYYYKIISNNDKKIHKWAEAVAAEHYDVDIREISTIKSPFGSELSKLKNSDREILHFLVLAEQYKLTEQKLKLAKKLEEKEKENLEKLINKLKDQERELQESSSKLSKKDSATANGVIQIVG